jgi:hypothetical protein
MSDFVKNSKDIVICLLGIVAGTGAAVMFQNFVAPPPPPEPDKTQSASPIEPEEKTGLKKPIWVVLFLLISLLLITFFMKKFKSSLPRLSVKNILNFFAYKRTTTSNLTTFENLLAYIKNRLVLVATAKGGVEGSVMGCRTLNFDRATLKALKNMYRRLGGNEGISKLKKKRDLVDGVIKRYHGIVNEFDDAQLVELLKVLGTFRQEELNLTHEQLVVSVVEKGLFKFVV